MKERGGSRTGTGAGIGAGTGTGTAATPISMSISIPGCPTARSASRPLDPNTEGLALPQSNPQPDRVIAHT
jgi:hypothetical protein